MEPHTQGVSDSMGEIGSISPRPPPAWQETLDETERNGHPNPATSSMKNQFLCHWDFVHIRSPRKESRNLDTKIPDRGLVGFLQNGCN